MKNAALKLAIALNNLKSNEDGQGILEYSLICALVGVTAAAGLTLLSGAFDSTMTSIITELTGAPPAP